MKLEIWSGKVKKDVWENSNFFVSCEALEFLVELITEACRTKKYLNSCDTPNYRVQQPITIHTLSSPVTLQDLKIEHFRSLHEFKTATNAMFKTKIAWNGLTITND